MRQDPIKQYYNQTHLTENSRKGYYSEKVQFITGELAKLAKTKSLNILDIACNDGELTKHYGKYGQIMGIDINQQSVKKCQKRGVKCLQAEIGDLVKSHRQKFDVVIAGDIIEHVFDTDQFLIDISQVLKKNGVLLLTTANLASFGRRIMLLLGLNPFIEFSSRLPSKEFNVGHIRYYTVDNMKMQLEDLKFKNYQIYGDRINFTKDLAIPYAISKYLPTWSRNIFVYAEKK